ncbi:MAG TPA: response regulator [Gemmatimonadales bacterium]|nr:response regulator [Gemmatimonadales bacterium]
MNTARTKRYWGTQRVARVLQVTPATVASWIDQGHLKGHRTPTGRRRVAAVDLADFLTAHGMAVPSDLLGTRERQVVVVVEDDPAYMSAMVRSIQRDAPEMELVQASTGMDGLLEIGRVNPDLVILDYALPDLNAVQVVERLQGRRSPVMIVTGGLPAAAENDLRRLGVRAIVNKVDGLEVVIEAMRRSLQTSKKAAVA